jgi:hypothetical protein
VLAIFEKGTRPLFRRLVMAVCLTGLLAASVAAAQGIWRGGYGFRREPPRLPNKRTFQGGYNFCRGIYESDRREAGGSGWNTDYPGADINFSIRLGELTKTNVTMSTGSGESDDPEYVTIQLADEALFQCPMLVLEDAGTARFSDLEVTRLRQYLLKGGFILSADYWGTLAQQQFDEEMGRVLPRAQYPIVDVPMNHSIWHTLFEVKKILQVSSIQFWRMSGGEVSERGEDSPAPDTRAIVDEHGRLMVLMLHNTDIPDGWEREAEDPEYFYRFSPETYAIGINVVLYSMTH